MSADFSPKSPNDIFIIDENFDRKSKIFNIYNIDNCYTVQNYMILN